MDIDNVSLDENIYFIAEAGVNHNGSTQTAKRLIDVAAESGANAVKFQTFSTERLVSESAPRAEYQETDHDSQYEMLKQYELSREDHEIISSYCESRDITFLSTPFDHESLRLLDDLEMPVIKLGSGELDNHPLLEAAASLGRPLIVSTGMSTLEEISAALDCIRNGDSAPPVALLHCVSAYPTRLEDVNLRAMQTLAKFFDMTVGFSDHTTNSETPAFAVGAGARIVEKHFTLDSSMSGPDHQMSLEPSELSRSVTLARNAEKAMGSDEKQPVEAELSNKSRVRKSLHAARSLSAGETLTQADLRIVRPANGLSPSRFSEVLGWKVATPLDENDPITESDITEK
jgi:N-acetylneuraminate synthase/N,N'-diacetyllegionaminate synthase